MLLAFDIIRLLIVMFLALLVVVEMLNNLKKTKKCSIISIIKTSIGIFFIFTSYLAYFILIYSNQS